MLGVHPHLPGDDGSALLTGYDKWLAYGQAKTANSLFAVRLDGLGGLYLEDCDVARAVAADTPMDDGGVREHAVDPGAAVRLWELSGAATGAAPVIR